MGYGFLDIATTPSVKAAQEHNGSAALWTDFDGDRDFDRFSEAETDPPPLKWSALKYGFEPTRGRTDAEEDPQA